MVVLATIRALTTTQLKELCINEDHKRWSPDLFPSPEFYSAGAVSPYATALLESSRRDGSKEHRQHFSYDLILVIINEMLPSSRRDEVSRRVPGGSVYNLVWQVRRWPMLMSGTASYILVVLVLNHLWPTVFGHDVTEGPKLLVTRLSFVRPIHVCLRALHACVPARVCAFLRVCMRACVLADQKNQESTFWSRTRS